MSTDVHSKRWNEVATDLTMRGDTMNPVQPRPHTPGFPLARPHTRGFPSACNQYRYPIHVVFRVCVQHLGLDHPLTAVSYDALGVALQQRGAFGDAEPQILKALGIRRRVLGESHPAVGSSLHNLGGLMADQGRAEEAETLYVAALELREAVLGPGHPAFAATLNNLAALYKARGLN
jgi:hypothetical protein